MSYRSRRAAAVARRRARTLLALLLLATLASLTPAIATHQDFYAKATFSPLLSANDWAQGPVTVTLTCEGTAAACDMNYTLDQSDMIPYTAPFSIEGEGIHSLLTYATVEGSPAEPTPESYTVRIDNTPPSLFFSPEDTDCSVPGTSPWCQGPVELFPFVFVDETESPVTLECFEDGVQVSCDVWTIEQDGVTNATATATDEAGNVASSSLDIHVDATAPTPPSLDCSANGAGWCNTFAHLTAAFDNASDILSKTCILNDVTIACDAGAIASEGNLSFSSSAEDNAGLFATDSATLRVDVTPPTLALSTICSAPAQGGWCAGPVEYKLNASDDGSGLAESSPACTIDDEPAPCHGNVTTSGAHILAITATDLADNANASNVTVALDLADPSIFLNITCSSPGTSPWCRGGLDIELVAMDDETDPTVTCSLDEAPAGACADVFDSLTHGQHTLAATAIDEAGRTNSTSSNYAFDNTPPDVAITLTCPTPGSLGYCLTTFTYNMTSTDNGSGIESATCTVDGVGSDCHGTVSTQGTHTVAILATDAAGNTNSTEASLAVDSAPPFVLSSVRQILPGEDDNLAHIRFQFSEPMSRAATEASLVGATGWTLAWSEDNTWLNLTLASNAEGATVSVTVGANATDAHGLAMGTSVTRSTQVRGPRDYAVTSVPYNFVNISQTGNDTGIYCDDCGTNVEMPFGFTYFGHTYYELNVSSNGFVTFANDDCLVGSVSYRPNPFPGTCHNLLAAFWEDLDVRLGSPGPNATYPDKILTQTIGEAPERVFLVTWNVVHHYSNVPPLATFQIKLFETSNVIEIHYENATPDEGDHMIGLINANGTRHTTYAFAPIALREVGLRFSGSGTQGDITPPTVSVTGDEGIITDANATIVYSFSEPMDTIETLLALTGADDWLREWNANGTVLTITNANLSFGFTNVTLTTRAADVNGVRIVAPVTRSIERQVPDTTAPTVTLVGSVGELRTPNATIEFRFSERMNTTATLAALHNASEWNVSWNEAGTVLLVSIDEAPAGFTTLTLTTQATDAPGNALAANATRTIERRAPTATLGGSSGLVGASATILFTFNTPMDPNATLAAIENVTGWNATWNEAVTELTLTNHSLAPGETTLTLTTGARAIHGLHLGENASRTVERRAPTVEISGSNGEVGSNATITFTFNVEMDQEATLAAIENATSWNATWNASGKELTLTNHSLAHGATTLTITTAARATNGLHLAQNASRTVSRAPPPGPTSPDPLPEEPSAPGVPTGLVAVLDGTTVTLAWGPPSELNRGTLEGYIVTMNDGAPVTVPGGSYRVSGLARGATYTFRVAAVTNVGTGESSLTSVNLPPVSTLDIRPAASNGWHTTLPIATLTADPADATILYDLGSGEHTYTGPITIPGGESTLRWHARSGGIDEATREQAFRVDPQPPAISGATAQGGATLTIDANVADTGSGIDTVHAIVTGPTGPTQIPLTPTSAGIYRGETTPAPGTYSVTIVARDVAGNEASASAGDAIVGTILDLTPDGDPPAGGAGGSGGDGGSGGGGIPLEGTSNDPPGAPASGDETENETEREPEPQIVIETGDNATIDLDAGARGTVRVRLEGVNDIDRVRVIAIDENGDEHELSSGAIETTWDTTEVEDGYYTIEARRTNAPPGPGELGIQSSHEVTLASARVLVRNPITPPVEVAAVVVGSVLVTAAAHAGLSAAAAGASSASTGLAGAAGGVDPLGFAQEVAIDAGQDKLRDKTRERDRQRRVRSLLAASGALIILAGLWAFSETEGWSLNAWIVALPIVGTAAAIVMAMKYSSESALAYATAARPRVRVWIAGAISLAISSIIFRNPFGYPAYVDETEESEDRKTWRMQGQRGVATIAGGAAFMLPFLALAPFVSWQFTSIGLLIAATNAATTAMPFGPLPGKDVWRWKKWLAVVMAVGGLAIYVGFASALAPMWSLWLVALAGATYYAVALVRFRQTLVKPRRVPVSVPIPVRNDEAHEPEATAPDAHGQTDPHARGNGPTKRRGKRKG